MSAELTLQLRECIENTIRFLTIDAVERAGIGHIGAPMGLARPAFELWDRYLQFDPSDPRWPLRDRFVLSNGHASMLQYSLLHLFGFDLSLEDIASFRTLGSRTPGHPEYGDTAGVEVTTGPLGQGFGHGVGMALAGRLARARFAEGAEGPGHHTVYGICSDGDLMEGISSEAASLAGHLGLGNLIYLYDDNRITIDGPTDLSFSENVRARFESQGWHVEDIDGEDVGALRDAIDKSLAEGDRPSLVVTRTTIGHGSPKLAGTSKAHGGPMGEEEVLATKRALGWPLEPDLLVPEDVRAYCKERGESKRRARRASDERLQTWRAAAPEKARAWDEAREGKLPANLAALLCEGMDGVSTPTRKHSAAVLEKLAERVPYLLGGSADLAGSGAPPILKDRGSVGPGADSGDPFAGRNIHFGVREHAMAAVSNGIALDGTFRPYCGTFLIFSDYMRPSIRLAALMGVPTIFVFTHDSIFVGEDGPTHQPIEQLDSLRAVPNLPIFRPADGIETAMAYAWIMEHRDGPALLALSRQTVPAFERPTAFEPQDVWKGAYAVRQPAGDARPDVVVVATGSEVPLACDAAGLLEAAAEPIAVRVVSIPCLELFLDQPDDAQTALVPDDGTPLVAVEAGRGESLRSVVGRRGLVYGIDRFGASAPYEKLAEAFGFTPKALAKRIRTHVRG